MKKAAAKQGISFDEKAKLDLRLFRTIKEAFDLMLRAWEVTLPLLFVTGIIYGSLILASNEFSSDTAKAGMLMGINFSGIMIVNLLWYCYIVYLSSVAIKGESFKTSLFYGLKIFFPVLALEILVGLIMGLGLLLLAIPGFMVVIMNWLPRMILIAENPGPIRSIGAAIGILKKNLGNVLLFSFLNFVVVLLAIGIINIIASFFGPKSAIKAGLSLLASASFVMYMGAFGVAAYQNVKQQLKIK